MSLVGRVRGEVEKTRHLQELTRRDETKLPDGAASTYAVTDAVTNHDTAAGWLIEGLPYPTFTRQGDLVVFNGIFRLDLPYTGIIKTVIDVGGVPAEFRPFNFQRIFSGGIGFTDDRLWMFYLWSNGALTLADMHVNDPFGHPNPAWGDATVPPSGDTNSHVMHLNCTYPAASLGLGAFPA